MADITLYHESKKYNNPRLNKLTANINKIGDRVRKEAYKVAYWVADCERTGEYKLDGFETVHDWTKDAFGWERSASYNWLKIGQEYTAVITDEAGKVTGVECALGADFSSSQVIALFPLGKKETEVAVANKVITPNMSCRAIKAKVAEIKEAVEGHEAPEEEPEEQQDAQQEEAQEEAPEEATTDITAYKLVCDNAGNWYKIPLEVLEQYAHKLTPRERKELGVSK